MNKLFRKAAAVILGAALFISQSQVSLLPGHCKTAAAFAASGGSAGNPTSGRPEVLSYSVTDSHGKEITSISKNKKFNLQIVIMDRQLKMGDISNAADIIFTKSMGRFKCGKPALKITSAAGQPLEYSVTLKDCVWQGGSKSFGFLVGYASGTDFFDLTFDLEECSEPSVTPDPDPDPSGAEPIFKISAEDTSEIRAGESGDFTLILKNLGSVDAERVLVEITSSDDIILTSGSYSHDIGYIGAYDTEKLTVSYKALGKISSAKQSFEIRMRYYYDTGNGETIGSASSTVNLIAQISESSEKSPLKVTSDYKTEIKAGEEGEFTLNINNTGAAEVVRVTVETSASDDVLLLGECGSQDILIIPANYQTSLRIKYKALDSINSSKQSFPVKITYKCNGFSEETTANVVIPAKSANDEEQAPLLKLLVPPSYEPLKAKSEYEFVLTLKNFGETAVSGANLFFDASDSLYIIDGTDVAAVGEIPANGSAEIKVKFRTADSVSAIKQSLTAHVTYSYILGGVKKNAETDCSATLIAKGGDETQTTTAVPNIIVKSYDIGAEQIAAGETFALKLTLLNTSAAAGVENIIMTVNAGGSINIFGGTNTFYYSKLGAGGELAENIPLKALATAETGTASISLSLKYDYLDKGTRNTLTGEQTIFIPVYQPDKMTFEVNVPTYTVMPGQDTYITTTYLNKGRSDISNVKAEIVGDVSALSTSKVIGTVQPGGNGSFDFIVNPNMAGMCEFVIKVTYEDATLKEVTKEFQVSFPVEEMFDPGFIDPGFEDPGFEDPTDEGGNFPWLILWIGIGVLVAGGVVTLIIVVNHRKKKKKALTEADIDWEDEFEDIPSGSGNNNNNNNNTTTTV